MKRDTSRALEIVAELEPMFPGKNGVALSLAELRKILEDMDARTGRRDPTKRGRT